MPIFSFDIRENGLSGEPVREDYADVAKARVSAVRALGEIACERLSAEIAFQSFGITARDELGNVVYDASLTYSATA